MLSQGAREPDEPTLLVSGPSVEPAASMRCEESATSTMSGVRNIDDEFSFAVRAAPTMLCGAVGHEVGTLTKFALPNMIGNALFMLLGVVDIAVVGHLLPSDDLAAAVLGITCFNLIAYALQGFATAVDTLAANAMGAKNRRMSERWTWLTGMVLGALLIPASVLLGCSGIVVKVLFRQPDAIAAKTGVFCLYLIPGLWALLAFQVVQKLMNAQGEMMPAVIVFALGNVVNLVCGVVLIQFTGIGLAGSSLATTASRFAMCAALSAWYAVGRARRQRRRGGGAVPYDAAPGIDTVGGVRSDMRSDAAFGVVNEQSDAGGGRGDAIALHNAQRSAGGAALAAPLEDAQQRDPAVGAEARSRSLLADTLTVLKLGIPGGCMMALEAGAFEITTIFAAQISPTAVSAHAIMLQVSGFIYMTFAVALMVAASVRVGNTLGRGWGLRAGDAAGDARRAARVAIALGAIVMAIAGAVVLALRHELALVFVKPSAAAGNAADAAQSSAIRSLVVELAPYAAAFSVADGVQGVAQGVLRGCGMQRTIAIANLCGFWLLGVPLGWYSCFSMSLGVKGLWIGLIIGLSVVSVILFCLVAWLDWDAAVGRAVAMQAGGVQNDPPPSSVKSAQGVLELVQVDSQEP